MGRNRLEALSDGVIAIIITIMVLELAVPHGSRPVDLVPLIPTLVSYVLSFVFLGIYWNNHHHLLHTVTRITGGALWANLHLLFWLSLVPFVTAWMGETRFAPWPVALYGVDLAMSAVAYAVLVTVLTRAHGKDSVLARAVGSNRKGWVSLGLYVCAVPLAFVSSVVSCLIYVVVAGIWLVPDRRIERVVGK